MTNEAHIFFAAQAWVQGAWAYNVLLKVDTQGHWSKVQANTPTDQRQGAQVLSGPVLPGIVNAHSHAFQRAIAGLTERRSFEGGGAIPRSAQVKEERPKGAGDTEQSALRPTLLAATKSARQRTGLKVHAPTRLPPGTNAGKDITAAAATVLSGGLNVAVLGAIHHRLVTRGTAFAALVSRLVGRHIRPTVVKAGLQGKPQDVMPCNDDGRLTRRPRG